MRHVSFSSRLLVHAALLLVALGLVAVAARAQETVAPAGPTIEIGEGVISDTEIRSRIQTIFREIEGLNRIFVSVSSGVVTLNGRVEEAALARKA